MAAGAMQCWRQQSATCELQELLCCRIPASLFVYVFLLQAFMVSGVLMLFDLLETPMPHCIQLETKLYV
jgi:hypothetical protein